MRQIAQLPRVLLVGAAFSLIAASVPTVALAATPASQSASVAITDGGYQPASVTVAAGGSVTWTNNGSNVHTVTDAPGSAAGVDSGGLQNGQTYSFTFSNPGTYNYTSATDCLGGNSFPSFGNCAGGVVNVVAPGAAAAAPSAPAPSAPAPSAPAPSVPAPSVPASSAPAAAATSAVQQSASVAISDSTFSPANVTVTVGGTVTWTNQGNNVHNATTTQGGPTAFDTGGLGNGQNASVNFVTPGTYAYTSATDCLNGNNNLSFNCGASYTVTVTNAPASGVTPAAPAPAPVASVPAAPASAAPAAAPSTAPASGLTVIIDDTSGFQPNSLTVHAGQTLTWTNKGNNVHTVVSNSGTNPSFDSGGLGNGQSFSFTFTNPGSYPYHSSTEPVYTTDSLGNTIVSYQFTGTIVVQ